MKTLDEVITCLDGCGTIDCDDCPYHYEDEKIEVDDCAQVYKDALFYLKEYRAKNDNLERTKKLCFEFVGSKMKEEEKQGRALFCPNCGDEFIILPEPNDSLTWNELKTMEGKPVWIEYDDHFPGKYRTQYKEWEVIHYVLPDRFVVKGEWDYHESELGEIWQAYRKERE